MGIYLQKLVEKCNIDKKLEKIITDLFDKLIYFGYITQKQVKTLEKKLYNNIDTVYIGDDIKIDYKTGYYDAIKKELYIKDISNYKAVYLRLLYALTTTFVNSNCCYVGYSKVYLSKNDYSVRYENFGINRAITSNLVCRLLNTDPTALSIFPTYKTYENDFLGNKISADNDIYFLEARILNQFAYILNIEVEKLYVDIFSKSRKDYFEKLFSKIKFKDAKLLLENFDKISLDYSNYNKLTYLNKLLNDNYLNIKKRFPNMHNEDLEQKKSKINLLIQNTLEKIIIVQEESDDDNLEPNIERRLSEQIITLEDTIFQTLSNIQVLETNFLICNENETNTFMYALKLKKLQGFLVTPNPELDNYLFKIITEKLMFSYEKDTSSNVEKLKYSIINEILKNENYSKMYESMYISKIPNMEFDEETEIVVLTIDNTFIQFIQINNLFTPINNLNNNAKVIQIDSMEDIIQNNNLKKDIPTFEKIYASLKNKYPHLSNLKLKDIFIANLQNHCVILIQNNNSFELIEFNIKSAKLTSQKLKLSDPYQIFNPKNFSNIPILYKKKALHRNDEENKGNDKNNTNSKKVKEEIKVKEIKR